MCHFYTIKMSCEMSLLASIVANAEIVTNLRKQIKEQEKIVSDLENEDIENKKDDNNTTDKQTTKKDKKEKRIQRMMKYVSARSSLGELKNKLRRESIVYVITSFYCPGEPDNSALSIKGFRLTEKDANSFAKS